MSLEHRYRAQIARDPELGRWKAIVGTQRLTRRCLPQARAPELESARVF